MQSGVNPIVDKQAITREIGCLSCEQPGNRHKPNEAHKPRRLTKTEKRLVRRIIERTTDADRLWAETNAHVAKSLGVNRSTVVRAINRLKKYGILCPVETRGGRGIPSSYIVDRNKAKKLLHTGHWPLLSSDPDTTEQNGDGRSLPNWVLADVEAAQNSIAQAADLLPPPQSGRVASAEWEEFVQELVDLGRETIAELSKRVFNTIQDPATWLSLGFWGLAALDAWAIYTVWKHKGPQAALFAAVPLGLATYGYWKLTELKGAPGWN